MTPDQINFRHCQVPGCDYKEPRFSREGHFIAGRFVCPKHAADPNTGRMLDGLSSSAQQEKP